VTSLSLIGDVGKALDVGIVLCFNHKMYCVFANIVVLLSLVVAFVILVFLMFAFKNFDFAVLLLGCLGDVVA
jgi:hypothetical protein